MLKPYTLLPVFFASLHLGICVANASPTTNEEGKGDGAEKKSEETVTIPHASIVLQDEGRSVTTVTGFSDEQIVELLHHCRAVHPGMRLEVFAKPGEEFDGQQQRIHRFQEIAKWKPVEPTIEVSFTETGAPTVDGIEFSIDQLRVLFANVRERQPGIVVALVGPNDVLFRHGRNVIACAAKAGISTTRFSPKEKAAPKTNQAEQDGAGQASPRPESK